MKFSLAAQFLSPAFAAAVASPSSVSVAEELAKKYGNHRDINADAAAAATSRASRDLESIHTTSTSKSSKSSSVSCPPEPTPGVECGNVYNSTATGEEVVVTLGQNLLCNENITEADDTRNAVLTLIGEKALLNCQGYTISQTTVNIDGIDTGSAAAVDCPIFPSNSTERLRMKQGCGLYFQWGVILKDGATMVNCNVQKFADGAGIEDGGEIKDSEFSLNRKGLQILNIAANTVSRISNSEFYNNLDGLYAYQLSTDTENSKVLIEDVTANNNAYVGVYLTGTGITVNNANIKNNLYGLGIGGNTENEEITLDGDITVTNNKYGFVTTDSVQGSLYVTGDFDLNRNDEVGLAVSSADVTIAVGGSYSGKSGKSVGSGSITACDNGLDIENFVGANFEGTDYTCERTAGTDLPVCKPCYPGCSSSDSDDGSGSGRSLGLSDFVAGDLDLMAMDMEYPV